MYMYYVYINTHTCMYIFKKHMLYLYIKYIYIKSFNARLAVDYPAYCMVICQVIDKLKLVLLLICSAIFDRMGKNDSYFHQLRLVSASILPASNQTQR